MLTQALRSLENNIIINLDVRCTPNIDICSKTYLYVTDIVSVLFKYNKSTCFHIEQQHFETRHIRTVTRSQGFFNINAKQLH